MTAQALMFHHFHGAQHQCGQGSISACEFLEVLDFVGLKRILPARDWLHGTLEGSLPPDALCLTFDDALLSQYEVALPVLQSLDLTAFFFVYSSVFEGKLEKLEIYRKFRDTQFQNIDDFYSAFDRAIVASDHQEKVENSLVNFVAKNYLSRFPFYSDADRRFRYLRDAVLGPTNYQQVMDIMIANAGCNSLTLSENLWMNNEHLRELHENGHVLGLHSFSHPTRMASLHRDDQHEEYSRNSKHLNKITGTVSRVMAHPCSSYNSDTLSILTEMGVRLGFRADPQGGSTALEIPRQDHATLMSAMKNRPCMLPT